MGKNVLFISSGFFVLSRKLLLFQLKVAASSIHVQPRSAPKMAPFCGPLRVSCRFCPRTVPPMLESRGLLDFRSASSSTSDPRPLRLPIRGLLDSRSAPVRPVNRLPVNPFTPPLPLLPALNEKGASPGRETLRAKSLSHKREGVFSSSWHRSSGSPVR